MKSPISLLVFFTLLLFFSCSSPKQKFDKGDFKAAFNAALKQMKSSKKASEANRDILIKSLDKIYLEGQNAIETFETSSDITDIEKAYNINQDLLKKMDTALPYLNGKFDFNLKNALTKEEELTDILIEEYLRFGYEDLEESIESGNKYLAQQAHKYFKKADKYGAQQANLDSLYEICQTYGTIVYLVDARAPFDITFNWEIDRRFDDLENQSSYFKKIIYDRSTEQIDCFLDIRFNSLSIDQSERTSSQNFTKEIKDGVDTSGAIIYKKIEGQVKTIEIVKVAEWEVRISIDSKSNNCKLSGNRFTARTESSIKEYEWSGNEDAIPSGYDNPFPNKLESDDDMAEILIEELYERVLREYF